MFIFHLFCFVLFFTACIRFLIPFIWLTPLELCPTPHTQPWCGGEFVQVKVFRGLWGGGEEREENNMESQWDRWWATGKALRWRGPQVNVKRWKGNWVILWGPQWCEYPPESFVPWLNSFSLWDFTLDSYILTFDIECVVCVCVCEDFLVNLKSGVDFH